MKRKLSTCMLVATLGCFANSAIAQETKLIFVTLNPPLTRLNTELMEPWAKRINEQGKGIVSIDVRHGSTLANLGNIYNRVQDDVVQIGFGLQTMIGGKFTASEIVALPIWDDQEKVAVAFWKLYKTGALGTEYDDIVPLILSPTAQAGLHYSKVPRSVDDLAGQKIMVAGKIPGQMISAAGGTPLSISVAEVYEALQRGTVDAAALAWTSFEPFKLAEVTKYHVNVRAGASASMVFMSKKRFNALSPAAQRVLMDNSGEVESRIAGAWWHREMQRGRQLILDDKGQTVVELNDQQRARWQENERTVTAEWVRAQPGRSETLQLFEQYLKQSEVETCRHSKMLAAVET